jgi:hypothetical protein
LNLNDDVVCRCRRLGRSTGFIPAVPAAWFITTIAFIVTFLCVVGRHLSNSFGDEERLSGGEEMRWAQR